MTLPKLLAIYDKKQDFVFLEKAKYDARQKYFDKFVNLCARAGGSLRKRKDAKGRGWAIPAENFSSIQSEIETMYALVLKTGEVVLETLDPIEEAMDFWSKGGT